jgi:hypothetical protein
MSEVRLNILDVNHSINGTTHGSVADAALAALSAEPETIEELQDAMARFIKPIDNSQPFSLFEEGTDDRPWDAGVVFFDLAARVAAAESSYSELLREGEVQYHNGMQLTDVWLPYQIPDDWLLLDSIAEYEDACPRRRAERAAIQPLDARPILFATVIEFIVDQCIAARAAGIKHPIAEIHARWLMAPREDLGGLSPRDVMFRKLEFIDRDLQWRETQWSRLREPPHCLSHDSAAYCFAGFGTHAFVMYYELLRVLLSKCWKRVRKGRKVSAADEVMRLEKIKSEWLETPDPDFGARTPAFILECERRRLPLIATAEELVIDEDCPCCRWMAEEHKHTPTFWHLDGCNMDDDFPFSFCRTRAEWEEERCSQEEFNRQWEEEENSRTELPLANDPPVIH